MDTDSRSSSPLCRRVLGSRDRSRSPTLFGASSSKPPPSPDVVIRMSNETGSPLGHDENFSAEDLVVMDHFMAPDAHPLYVRVEHMQSDSNNRSASDKGVIVKRDDEIDRQARARNVRSRMRGGRQVHVKGRGRSSRGNGDGCRQRHCTGWQIGYPIEEIWVTDDDVPQELRELAKDVMRKRQEKIEMCASGKRKRSPDEKDNMSSEEEEVYHDAANGTDDSMLEGEDLHFEWDPMETFRGGEEKFKPKRTGSVSNYTNSYDAFRSYWDDSILQTIVDETNHYASKISSTSFQKDWYPTNCHEVLCLFALWMMSGIIRMPTISSYFSKNVLLKTEIFARITSLSRYNSLHRALRFGNTYPTSDAKYTTTSSGADYDRIYRLRPIINHLNLKFQSNYILAKDIRIDKLNFKRYIWSKAAKLGIQSFELYESTTGYLWSFLIHTGKNDHVDRKNDLSLSNMVVLKLVKPLLNKGYRLFMDNWFNSPSLARFLKRNGTDCVGTLSSSRKHVPKLVTEAPLKQGQLIARHSGDICVLSWQDKRRINMITTCHNSAAGLSTVPSRPLVRPLQFKPQAALDYNKFMSGEDLTNMMLEPYLLDRCTKWYIKLFKRLLNCSIENTRILLESTSGKRLDNLQFRLELVQGILNHHHHLTTHGRFRRYNITPSPYPLHNTSSLEGFVHWPITVTPTEYEASRNRSGRRRCVVCNKAKKVTRTPYQCEACGVALCIENCYKIYHTTLRSD